ncbi:putative addiction module component [mine drainage metagenome]|jgi:putative addiction module component (TIGR02574 family)|uniref:Putative addiction module component n=1 Tax=mine drainage metagenome TaxID=410659 RepID=A0A1J5QJD9_9ZZZZ
MSNLLVELSQRARTLPPEERAQLAEDLLASLQEDGNPEIEAAWDEEICKRLDEIERGVAKLVPAEEVFAEARRTTR